VFARRLVFRGVFEGFTFAIVTSQCRLEGCRKGAAKEGSMKFEVHFRGKNAFESDGVLLDRSKGEMRAWKPAPLKQFEVDEDVARVRYAELLRDGVAGREVDDVVPFVVALMRVDYVLHAGVECRLLDTVEWAYAETESD
jgi:hypothetical protein